MFAKYRLKDTVGKHFSNRILGIHLVINVANGGARGLVFLSYRSAYYTYTLAVYHADSKTGMLVGHWSTWERSSHIKVPQILLALFAIKWGLTDDEQADALGHMCGGAWTA